MSLEADVLIIGAGIVGASCAYSLSQAGLSVTVLESAFAGGGTTAAAMGHIVVMDDSEAQFALTQRGRELWTELAPELPASCEDEPRGTLWVAADAEEMAHVQQKAQSYQAHGVAAEVLDEQALREAEPELRPGLAGGLRVPDDRVLYPPTSARWLLDRAEDLGAKIEEGVEVLELGPNSLRTRAGWRQSGWVILAAGFTSTRLLKGLPIEPRKGHLVITDRAPDFAHHQLVELGYLKSAHTPSKESVAFNLQPRATGQMLLGSSREFVGFDPTLNRALRERMLRRAFEYMPRLTTLSALRTWVGFRPCTRDNLPLIGAYDEIPGLIVATGHEGLGVTTAPATAELVRDRILGQPPRLDPAPYSPLRSQKEFHG